MKIYGDKEKLWSDHVAIDFEINGKNHIDEDTYVFNSKRLKDQWTN